MSDFNIKNSTHGWLFNSLMAKAAPRLTEYFSDVIHDANFIIDVLDREPVDRVVRFYWAVRDSGTYMALRTDDDPNDEGFDQVVEVNFPDADTYIVSVSRDKWGVYKTEIKEY